ncbi:IucA/IucC family protein [Microbulbifer sp. ZKSA006]|uniref:IucA/IucC family protein n=1 Tax=Microbulbifer sp. ZKSA006 TaxID=3243390 RepID=UPI0040392221
MLFTAKELAEKASFQAFANAYIREVDPGVWHTSSDWQLQTGVALEEKNGYTLELYLNGAGITLALEASYRSIVGRHVFTKSYRKSANQWNWQPIDFTSVIMLLIDNIYTRESDQTHKPNTPANKIELLNRTLESLQIMQNYLAQRLDDPSLNNSDYISSEQSLLFGHWLHPTPKSRQGIHSWQHEKYTPELKSKFQLHFFAISREFLEQDSFFDESVEQIINRMLGAEGKDINIDIDKQLIPVHPLQAQWLLHQDYIQHLQRDGLIVDLGLMGKMFTPTSSVRTLYCSELNYMIKLSIPVKITNSLRKNRTHELDPGLNIGKLFSLSNFKEKFPQFTLIEDPAFITVKLPHMQETGFETIIRQNPFSKDIDTQGSPTLSIAALVQDPILPGTQSKLAQQVLKLASKQGVSAEKAALKWFNCYWQCAIEPTIILYDSQGIGLEAHQQNSLLTIHENCPIKYYYRDNQGFYLSEKMQGELLTAVPELSNNPDLFYPDNMITDRVGYYLFINQLFSVIGRLGQDNLIDEGQLLKLSYNKLKQLKHEALKGVGINFINRLFNNSSIPCKGNLLTRVEDIDELEAEKELAVYTNIRNPFFDLHQKYLNNAEEANEVALAHS